MRWRIRPRFITHRKIDIAKVLAHAPNAVWLETDPNNADSDADGATEGSEDVNSNGIVDLQVIDRNQTDGNGNYVVVATFNDFKQSATVTGTFAGSQPVTLRYSDFCGTYVEPTNSVTYTSTRLDRTKLDGGVPSWRKYSH